MSGYNVAQSSHWPNYRPSTGGNGSPALGYRSESVSPQEQHFQQQRQQPPQPAAQRPTRRSSGITSQNTNRATPRVGLSEADAYNMPIEKLRDLASAQLRNQFGDSEPEYRTRISGTIADRVK